VFGNRLMRIIAVCGEVLVIVSLPAEVQSCPLLIMSNVGSSELRKFAHPIQHCSDPT
jgi:hypothetical protein